MIIAISNQKGGVGKTTTAINMSAFMARLGHNVLMVDLDPQENLTRAYGISNKKPNAYDWILGENKFEEVVEDINLDGASSGRLAIIPGSNNFSRYEKMRAGEVNSQFDLKIALENIEHEFDYILLDCPPTLGLITVNAFCCADYVLVPMEAQLFAMEGLERIVKIIENIKKVMNPSLSLEGIFFVRHDSRKLLNRSVADFIDKEYSGLLFNTSIRENVALREAPHEGKDIFAYEPTSNGAKDYQALTLEFINRICQKQKKE